MAKTEQKDPKAPEAAAAPAPEAPAATEPAKPEAAKAPAPERMQERLPAALVKGLKEAGLTEADILATKSYPEQKMWRIVTGGGQRHEFDFDGKWLTKPKPAPKAEKAKA